MAVDIGIITKSHTYLFETYFTHTNDDFFHWQVLGVSIYSHVRVLKLFLASMGSYQTSILVYKLLSGSAFTLFTDWCCTSAQVHDDRCIIGVLSIPRNDGMLW